MRFDDVWIAGTGGVLGDLVPVGGAVEDGSFDPIAAEMTGMVSVSQTTEAPPEMAVTAGREAIKAAEEFGVQTGQETIHLHSHSGFQGIDLWSAPCWIAGQLFGTQLTTIPTTVGAWSNGSLVSLGIAASQLTVQPDNSALITLADRFGPPGNRYHTSPGMVFGDGATAALVTRGRGRLRLRSIVSETDTVLGGLSRGKEPFRDAPLPGPPDMRKRTREFFASGEVSLKDVGTRSAERTNSVVTRALEEAGKSTSDVEWYAPPFVGKMLFEQAFIQPLSFKPRNTLLDLGLTIGHLGAADQIYALDHLLKEDLLEPGATVLIVGTSMGFSYSAAVFTADGV